MISFVVNSRILSTVSEKRELVQYLQKSIFIGFIGEGGHNCCHLKRHMVSPYLVSNAAIQHPICLKWALYLRSFSESEQKRETPKLEFAKTSFSRYLVKTSKKQERYHARSFRPAIYERAVLDPTGGGKEGNILSW